MNEAKKSSSKPPAPAVVRFAGRDVLAETILLQSREQIALTDAMKKMGIPAEIVSVFDGEKSKIFTLRYGVRERIIRISSEMMESKDPVSAIVDEAKALGIGK